MSSRLIPPNVGAMRSTVSQNFSGSFSAISMSKTSMPPYILNRRPFPSITGFPLIAPMSPSPSTAVPLLITATRFPLSVYLYASFGSFWISRHGNATPGEYAKLRSVCVLYAFVGFTSILPGRMPSW